MSEVENQSLSSDSKGQGSSILLPEASIAVFSKDPETLESARQLESDWRFARVIVGVEEGGVNSAIHSYQEFESPDLVIIQTEVIDDTFTAKLEELAGHCAEGTAAIVIGPVNDVNLYRTLIDMGISDYLVKPIAADVMAEICAKTLIEKIGVKGSRLIAFVGAKGGVGASSLCHAAACGVADILDQKTFLLDTCGGWSTMSVGMGFEPLTTLAEAARVCAANDEDSFNRMIFNASDKLHVLASGSDVMLDQSIDAQQLEIMIDMLMAKYPVIMVDISNSPQDLQSLILSRANQINVVSSQSLVSLRQARSLVKEITDLRGAESDGIEFMINMQGAPSAQDVPKKDIESVLGIPVSAFVPFETKIFQNNEAKSRKLSDDKDGEQLIKSHLLPVIQKVIAANYDADSDDGAQKSGGIIGDLMQKLSSK
ncbi:MAG: CpaE family protein [Bdellovibrionales bacterium]